MDHPDAARRNRLARETSPYLLQHAANPVDWYPWGPEALEKARREHRPILLSIGYSACHWCHVMERESFADARIAAQLAADFVSIKVDREERPDLDEIYMRALQALTGSGGWPLTVFLTPDLEPFFGGTYFPPHALHGRPGFPQVLASVAAAWRERRGEIAQRAAHLTEALRREGTFDTRGAVGEDVLARSLAALEERFDPRWGGFGGAPKFPHAIDLRLLLRHGRRSGAARPIEMACLSLERMADGGVHDQLGGGFHRYSTDPEWRIPHFEKMLYDNALLVPAYLEAFQVTGEPRFAAVARDVLEWALRELRTPEGAFASSQDADSEGEEGKFFAWTPGELGAVLGRRRGAWAAEWFGVTEQGTFEHGTSALWRPDPPEVVATRLGVPTAELEREMAQARAELFAARALRVPPATDDKVLTAWNGLLISALAQAAGVLEQPRYLAAANAAADFLLGALRRPDGRLLATYRAGRAQHLGGLDDHAFLIAALLDLYEADFDERRLTQALELEAVLAERFEDPERGGYFTTGTDHEVLLARLKSPQDGALPAGNGVMALNLLRLAALTGRGVLERRARRTLEAFGALVGRHPAAFGQLLLVVDFLAGDPVEVVLAGEPGSTALDGMLGAVRRPFLPHKVVALAHTAADPGAIPLLEGRIAEPGRARAFVCRRQSCRQPVETPAELAEELADAGALGPAR